MSKRLHPIAPTDAGNAEFLASIYGRVLRHDYDRKRWLIFRQHWWAEDKVEGVLRMAKAAARLRAMFSMNIPDEEERRQQLKWARQSESLYWLQAALKLARAERPLADAGIGWDLNPWLLGVNNGVVDLRTGTLRDGIPEDRITIHTDVQFDPEATCPRFEQFLMEVFDGDLQLIEFVQRAIGYSVTGDTSEQCLFLCHGAGANRKSTLLEIMRRALGDWAADTPFSTLELNGRTSIPNDVAALVGRRLVTASEINESVRLNEARVKMLTGGDLVSGRFLYKEFFSFRPVAKFWLSFNHLPQVVDDSHGFWRRIRLIRFPHEFRDAAEDQQLLQKLIVELPGILAWAVRGALAWQEQGLGVPLVVEMDTAAYRVDSDPLAEFIDDCCVVRPERLVDSAVLWEEYRAWKMRNGENAPLSRKAFTRRLESLGFRRVRMGHERTRAWQGICRKCDVLSPAPRGPAVADVRTDADASSDESADKLRIA